MEKMKNVRIINLLWRQFVRNTKSAKKLSKNTKLPRWEKLPSFIVHFIHPPLHSSSTTFIVHFIHRPLHSSSTSFIHHYNHRSLYSPSTTFILHYIHPPLHSSTTTFILHFIHPPLHICYIYVQYVTFCSGAGKGGGKGYVQYVTSCTVSTTYV